MLLRYGCLASFVLVSAILLGCDSGTPKVKEYQVEMPTGLERAKLLLKQYAEGGQLGSEVTSYEEIVEQAREEDPQKAEILAEGFEEIRNSQGRHGAIARELLEKLE